MPAYTYDPNKNPEGTYIDSVPLRDLTTDDVAALPAHIQAAIVEAPYYALAMSFEDAVIAGISDAPPVGMLNPGGRLVDDGTRLTLTATTLIRNDDGTLTLDTPTDTSAEATDDQQPVAADGEAAYTPPAVEEAAERLKRGRPKETK